MQTSQIKVNFAKLNIHTEPLLCAEIQNHLLYTTMYLIIMLMQSHQIIEQ